MSVPSQYYCHYTHEKAVISTTKINTRLSFSPPQLFGNMCFYCNKAIISESKWLVCFSPPIPSITFWAILLYAVTDLVYISVCLKHLVFVFHEWPAILLLQDIILTPFLLCKLPLSIFPSLWLHFIQTFQGSGHYWELSCRNSALFFSLSLLLVLLPYSPFCSTVMENQ